MESLGTKLKLEDILSSENLCDEIDDDDLLIIGRRAIEDCELDKESMHDWLERNEKAYEILEHTFHARSQPWHNAANAKIPLVLNAAIRFNSEAGAELLKGDKLVKSEIFGENIPEKVERARRVTAFMNYQLFHEMDNWDGDTDQLLVAVPILGCVHKKVYRDPVSGANCSDLCLDNVIINQETTSIKKARISQTFKKNKDDIYEREAAGVWREIEYSSTQDDSEDGIQEFVEQYRRIDLDGDGYQEPYIVTIHKDTQNPVRIAPNFREEDIVAKGKKIIRIDPNCYFVKYDFIPAYDGSYWSLGWGILLGPLNDHINTVVNQLLDAGTLSNLQGGWISSAVRSPRGDNRFEPGEWKTVKVSGGILRDSVMPLPVREPSQTMFVLLQLLLEQGRDITSVNDIMQGDQPQANMSAASVMALIERGMKTFNAIYKRLYRSLRSEFKKLYELNYQYTDIEMYRAFHDNPQADPRVDFGSAGYDVIPTANPEFSSRVQRMAQSEALMSSIGHPNVNDSMVLFDYFAAVLDDPKKAAQFVSVEPNMTPQQAMQQMEVIKQQMLDDMEVRKNASELDIKEIEKEIAILRLELARADAGMKLAEQENKTEQSSYSTLEEAISADIKEIERRLKQKELELADAKIEQVRADTAAQREETEALRRETRRDTEED